VGDKSGTLTEEPEQEGQVLVTESDTSMPTEVYKGGIGEMIGNVCYPRYKLASNHTVFELSQTMKNGEGDFLILNHNTR
jgi:hypothetical protein